MADWKSLRDALAVRIATAHTLAKAKDAGIVLIAGLRNEQEVVPSPDTNYMRAYWRYAATTRLSSGSVALERTVGSVFVQLLLKRETGDDLMVEIADAIAPAFRTASDQIEFEEAAELSSPYLSGEHWVAVVSFPFARHIAVTVAA